MMDQYTATEQAFKHGYEKGYEAGKPKWIPVTERLPEKYYEMDEKYFGEPIEFIVLIEGAECATVLCFNGDYFFNLHTDECYEVSHWMPLPEPPKEGE